MFSIQKLVDIAVWIFGSLCRVLFVLFQDTRTTTAQMAEKVSLWVLSVVSCIHVCVGMCTCVCMSSSVCTTVALRFSQFFFVYEYA